MPAICKERVQTIISVLSGSPQMEDLCVFDKKGNLVETRYWKALRDYLEILPFEEDADPDSVVHWCYVED